MTGVVGVAVDGSAFSANVGRSFGALLYVNNNGAFSELTGFQSGNDAQGQNVYASHDLSSTLGMVAGPTIGMASYTAVAGDIGRVSFTTTGPTGAAAFTATPSASWLVRPPAELIDALMTYISGAGLGKGIQTSLLAKLASAQSYLAGGDVASAVQAITDLVNEVKAQDGKHIGSSAGRRDHRPGANRDLRDRGSERLTRTCRSPAAGCFLAAMRRLTLVSVSFQRASPATPARK